MSGSFLGRRPARRARWGQSAGAETRFPRRGVLFGLLALPLLLAFASPGAAHARQQAAGDLTVTAVSLTNFQVVGNALVAGGTVSGTLAGSPFTTAITDFALQLVPDDPATAAVECAALALELAPIHLALLGLHVDTGRICLEIEAVAGGGLVGDLLCGLAGGGPLGSGIPLIPTAGELATLQGGLSDILNAAVAAAQPAQPAPEGGSGVDAICTGQCEILDLVMGPADLALLGLTASLDDCEGGPVRICVSAARDEGVLGDVLCVRSHSRSPHRRLDLTLTDVAALAERAAALSADDGTLSPGDVGELRGLLNRLLQ